MNIFEQAKKGIIPEEIKIVAKTESLSADDIMKDFVAGRITIIKNPLRDIKPVGVGKGLRTKVNANIGTSPDLFDINTELEKLDAAVKAGADAIMDLSTGGDLEFFRKKIIEYSPLPLGTVPIYETAVRLSREKKSMKEMQVQDFIDVVRIQAEAGVDFMTIHSGVTLESVQSLHSQKRITGITSRGGSMLAEWMKFNRCENPLFEFYDDILDILAEYGVIISLGD